MDRPVIVHRAVLGSVERMFAILTEHYAGKWPFWINPRQVGCKGQREREEGGDGSVREGERSIVLVGLCDLVIGHSGSTPARRAAGRGRWQEMEQAGAEEQCLEGCGCVIWLALP